MCRVKKILEISFYRVTFYITSYYYTLQFGYLLVRFAMKSLIYRRLKWTNGSDSGLSTERITYLLRYRIFPWVHEYNIEKFKSDLVAGFTVFFILIPQGLSYAVLAGATPVSNHSSYSLTESFIFFA